MTSSFRPDFGLTARDYGRHRAGFPPQLVSHLYRHGIAFPGQDVLDVGTGTGALARLCAQAGARVTGLDPAGPLLEQARELDREAGVESDYRVGTAEATGLPDASYDVVVLSRTLQALRRPAEVLAEIGRIGERCIVSVPNFGLWKHRVSLLVRGRMPMSRELPYPWFETPNIHLSTLADLEELFRVTGLRVEKRLLLDEQGRPLHAALAGLGRLGNLRAGAAAYLLTSTR